MNENAFLICTAFVLSACVAESDLDAEKKKNEERGYKIAAFQNERAPDRTQTESSPGGGTPSNSVPAKRPPLPVTFSLRKSLTGPGFVAVFSTTASTPLAVLATVESADPGTTRKFELHLTPAGPIELGHFEGAAIVRGDVIVLENTNFSPAVFTTTEK